MTRMYFIEWLHLLPRALRLNTNLRHYAKQNRNSPAYGEGHLLNICRGEGDCCHEFVAQLFFYGCKFYKIRHYTVI
jgi:hypothetical protein